MLHKTTRRGAAAVGTGAVPPDEVQVGPLAHSCGWRAECFHGRTADCSSPEAAPAQEMWLRGGEGSLHEALMEDGVFGPPRSLVEVGRENIDRAGPVIGGSIDDALDAAAAWLESTPPAPSDNSDRQVDSSGLLEATGSASGSRCRPLHGDVERDLEASAASMEDPAVVSDAHKAHEAFEAHNEAQLKLDQLFERWAELEEKKG